MKGGTQAALNRLTLAPTEVQYQSDRGPVHVRFLDYVVDGVSLRDRVRDVGVGQEYVTSLASAWVGPAVTQAVALLTQGTSAGEPADMLICRVCGDRDCGAVLADVTVEADVVTWSHWRWTNWETLSEPIRDLPNFHFNRESYEATVAAAPATVAELGYEWPSQVGKEPSRLRRWLSPRHRG